MMYEILNNSNRSLAVKIKEKEVYILNNSLHLLIIGKPTQKKTKIIIRQL